MLQAFAIAASRLSVSMIGVPSAAWSAKSFNPGAIELFVLHAADGTPIMLTDSREAAVANAWSHELETVSVH